MGACLWILIFQWGFLWYYLHSRNLCTTEQARLMCGGFHSILAILMGTKWLAWETIAPLLMGRSGWWSHLPVTLYLYAFIQVWPFRRSSVRKTGIANLYQLLCVAWSHTKAIQGYILC